jgi:hypothetical protein
MKINNVLGHISIPNYIEHVELSKSRRAIFYKKGDNIPKKYSKENFIFNDKGVLINLSSNEKVLKNTKSAGKPRYRKISGQDIWSGINHNLRSKIAKELKNYFKEFIIKSGITTIDESKYPLGVAIFFHKPIGQGNWDIDNHSLIYRKCILDSLVEKQIIRDDSVTYVRQVPCNYYDCLPEEKRIEIVIYSVNEQ